MVITSVIYRMFFAYGHVRVFLRVPLLMKIIRTRKSMNTICHGRSSSIYHVNMHSKHDAMKPMTFQI